MSAFDQPHIVEEDGRTYRAEGWQLAGLRKLYRRHKGKFVAEMTTAQPIVVANSVDQARSQIDRYGLREQLRGARIVTTDHPSPGGLLGLMPLASDVILTEGWALGRRADEVEQVLRGALAKRPRAVRGLPQHLGAEVGTRQGSVMDLAALVHAQDRINTRDLERVMGLEIDPGAPVVLGFDCGFDSDVVAVVAMVRVCEACGKNADDSIVQCCDRPLTEVPLGQWLRQEATTDLEA